MHTHGCQFFTENTVTDCSFFSCICIYNVMYMLSISFLKHSGSVIRKSDIYISVGKELPSNCEAPQ